MPSAAVARNVAVPAVSACITPFASMLATAGVSDVQVMVVGTVDVAGRDQSREQLVFVTHGQRGIGGRGGR